MTGWIAAAALLVAAPASAEILYSKDGVVFEGTLRKVVSQAGVCNVLEGHNTAAVYEQLKANQGQPLDLWRVDFSVRNESGRPLEFLRAAGWVRAEHPPCTNWSGPETPPDAWLRVEWGDYYELLQMPSGMQPEQETANALYLMVFHEHQPRFGEWDIDYRFAAASPAAGESGGGDQRAGGERAAAPAGASQLPPDIQADLYLRQAVQAVGEGDAASARAAMERLETLQREHELEPAPADHYRYAQAWAAAGEPERAMESAVRYLQLQGREAEHYAEALDLVSRAESGNAGRPAGDTAANAGGARADPPRSGFSADQTCAGKAKGSECWMELESHPSCYVWNHSLWPGETATTWTAGCSGGLASGSGTLKWVNDRGEWESSGTLRDGKHNGHWVSGSSEGSYVDGKKNGHWVEPWGDESGREGPYVDGKEHGHWVIRLSNGRVEEGPFVDGKQHGHWVERSADGSVGGGAYVNDRKHGHWVERGEEWDSEGSYVNGDPQGHWVTTYAETGTWEGPMVDGQHHGTWVRTYPNGNTRVTTWVNGEEQEGR